MNVEVAANRVKELSDLLHHYNYLYYVKNESAVSDYEFDQLLKELEGLEQQFPDLADENSPTKRVGGDITKNFETVQHNIPCYLYPTPIPRKKLLNGRSASKKPLRVTSNMFVSSNTVSYTHLTLPTICSV